MEFLRIPNEAWGRFFDGVTELMRQKLVEVEVVGIDVGDQVQAEWMPLLGVSYDPSNDALFIQTGAADGLLDHEIEHPREVFVELGPHGISLVAVIDEDGGKQFLRLRAPLELPQPFEPQAGA